MTEVGRGGERLAHVSARDDALAERSESEPCQLEALPPEWDGDDRDVRHRLAAHGPQRQVRQLHALAGERDRALPPGLPALGGRGPSTCGSGRSGTVVGSFLILEVQP